MGLISINSHGWSMDSGWHRAPHRTAIGTEPTRTVLQLMLRVARPGQDNYPSACAYNPSTHNGWT